MIVTLFNLIEKYGSKRVLKAAEFKAGNKWAMPLCCFVN